MVYSGPIGSGPGVETRSADALCLDARDAVEPEPGSQPVSPGDALAAVARAARASLDAGRTPVVAVDSLAAWLPVAAALADAGIAVRASRAMVLAAAAYREAGVAVPQLGRFASRLGAGEALLWPARSALPAPRAGSRPRDLVLVGPASGGLGAFPAGSVAVPYAPTAGLAGLLDYVAATGASEVALVNASNDHLERALRAKGVQVYALGPPRQVELFSARAA
jgi:hypothetical protein